MTVDKFINTLSDIDEKYVIEYLEIARQKSLFSAKNIKKWVLAASIVIVVGIGIIPIISELQISPYIGTIQIFTTYGELISYLPKGNLLENLMHNENYGYKYIGEYKNEKKFSSFSIVIMEREEVHAIIKSDMGTKENVEEYASRNVLVHMQEMNNVPVYYAYNIDEEYYEAVFVAEQVFYSVQVYMENEERLLEIVRDILE